MTSRRILLAGLLALLALNTLSGVAKVVGFRYRHIGERAIDSADMDRAFESLNASLFWQPDDSPLCALANSCPSLTTTTPTRG